MSTMPCRYRAFILSHAKWVLYFPWVPFFTYFHQLHEAPRLLSFSPSTRIFYGCSRYSLPWILFTSTSGVAEAGTAEVETLDSLLEGGEEEEFDWQLLQGPLMLLGAAGRCQRCFAALEEVTLGDAVLHPVVTSVIFFSHSPFYDFCVTLHSAVVCCVLTIFSPCCFVLVISTYL